MGFRVQVDEAGWRPMTMDDLPRVTALAAEIHPDYPEEDAVFAERLALCPAGCFVHLSAEVVDGYMLSHPWEMRNPPALNALLARLPETPDCWYLHDIALLPAARGKGVAAVAVAMVEALARGAGLPGVALMATGLARGYWLRVGFVAVEGVDAGSYGVGAGVFWRGVGRGYTTMAFNFYCPLSGRSESKIRPSGKPLKYYR